MMMQGYLPFSKPDSDDLDSGSSVDPFAGDWTECPYSHPGENARRRDPRKFQYSDAPCPDFWNGSCERGDSCEFAHGLYECWLHPARYRTQPCKDGKACDRRVCFFAHTPEQLRILPQQAPQTPSHSPKSAVPAPVDSYDGSPSKKEKGDCFVPSLGDTCQTTYRHEIKTTAAEESHLPGKGEKGKNILLEETAESSFDTGDWSVPYLRETCRTTLSTWDFDLDAMLNPFLCRHHLTSLLFESDASSFFHQILEMQVQKCEKMAAWTCRRRKAQVLSDFVRVGTMLNRLNHDIVSRPLEELCDENYKKAKSEVPRLFMYYDKHEIKMTAELLEKMLQEISDDGRFTEDWGFEELRKLSDYLLDFIEKWDSVFQEKKAAKSSGAKVEPQSKGVVSKTNALRKEDDSQRDDPEELFLNLVELETTLEECVFRFPQHASFIAAAGYKPILVV